MENDHNASVETESKQEFHEVLELGEHTVFAHEGLDAAEDGSEEGLRVHDANNSKERFAAGIRWVGALQVDFGAKACEDDKDGNHWDKLAGSICVGQDLAELFLCFLRHSICFLVAN